jgi:hypothetical protein
MSLLDVALTMTMMMMMREPGSDAEQQRKSMANVMGT